MPPKKYIFLCRRGGSSPTSFLSNYPTSCKGLNENTCDCDGPHILSVWAPSCSLFPRLRLPSESPSRLKLCKRCTKKLLHHLIRVAVTTSMSVKTHTHRFLKSVAQLLVLERASESGVTEVLLLNIRFSTPCARTAYALQTQGLRASIIHDRIWRPICQRFCFKTVCVWWFRPCRTTSKPRNAKMWRWHAASVHAACRWCHHHNILWSGSVMFSDFFFKLVF